MDLPPLALRKRFPWILYWIVLALIILIAFAPDRIWDLAGLALNEMAKMFATGLG